MNTEVIIAIVSLIISLFSLIVFAVYPFLIDLKIKKIFDNIFKFYKLYSILNPWLLNREHEFEDINLDLIHQRILILGLPRLEYLKIKDYNNFNPMDIDTSNWKYKLRLSEIKEIHKFWRLATKKLNYSKTILNNFNYIMKEKNTNNYIYTYNDYLFYPIEKTSISIAPVFDEIKLHGIVFYPSREHKQEKVDLNDEKISIVPDDRKEMINLFKDKTFSVNLLFKSDEKKITNYSYSINFV